MNKHKDCVRGFTQLSKAWYGEINLKDSPLIDKFNIGFYHPEGGTTGEFEGEWKELGGKIVPQLKCYDDGWSALFNFGDLLESMADVDDQNITPDEFRALLVALSIKDMTKTEDK